MNRILKHIVFLIIPFIGVACVKDQLKEADEDLIFNREYSIPVGRTEIAFRDFININNLHGVDTSMVEPERTFYYDDNFYFSPYVLEPTLFHEFDFSTLSENFESINSLMFRINYENGIPAPSEIKISFFNRAGTIENELFEDGWYKIEQANYDDDIIIPVKQYKHDTYLGKEMIQSLFDKETIKITMRFTVENPPSEIIKFYSDQTIKFQFAVRFGIETTSNDN